MCGRYFIEIDDEELNSRYGFINHFENSPGDKVPSKPSLVVTNTGFKSMRWGFPIKDKLLINARGETIMHKPAYSKSFYSRRCLVPASLFYEYNNGIKYSISLRDKSMFSMAAIHNLFYDEKLGSINSFVIITTEANCDILPIHPRMPVIMPRELEKYYLDETADVKEIQKLLAPLKAGLLSVVPSEGISQLSLF